MKEQDRTAAPDLDMRTWSVWRQDDHGNTFEVRRQLTQAEALRLVAEFEARGHKQSYWAEQGKSSSLK